MRAKFIVVYKNCIILVRNKFGKWIFPKDVADAGMENCNLTEVISGIFFWDGRIKSFSSPFVIKRRGKKLDLFTEVQVVSSEKISQKNKQFAQLVFNELKGVMNYMR